MLPNFEHNKFAYKTFEKAACMCLVMNAYK